MSIQEYTEATKQEHLRKLKAIQDGNYTPLFCNWGNHYWGIGEGKELQIHPCNIHVNSFYWSAHNKKIYSNKGNYRKIKNV